MTSSMLQSFSSCRVFTCCSPSWLLNFRNGAILEDGRPKEDSPEEKLTAEEAEVRARMTGSDIFCERIPKNWECLDIDLTEKKT